MRIRLKLSFHEDAACRLLNWLAGENMLIRQANPELPLLYDAGIVYRREPDETWRDYPNMLIAGHEDCDSLAAARTGEILAHGAGAFAPGDVGYEQTRGLVESIPAEVMLLTRSTPEDPGLYHCIVRFWVGDEELRDDPSARLGMLGTIDPEVQRRWRQRAGNGRTP